MFLFAGCGNVQKLYIGKGQLPVDIVVIFE